MQQGVLTELLNIYTKLHKCMAQRRRSPQLRTCIFRRNSPPMRTPVLTTFIMEEMRRPNAPVSSHLQGHTAQVILMSHMTAGEHTWVSRNSFWLIDWLLRPSGPPTARFFSFGLISGTSRTKYRAEEPRSKSSWLLINSLLRPGWLRTAIETIKVP